MKSIFTALILSLGVVGIATVAQADDYPFPEGYFEQLDQEGPGHSVLPQDPSNT